MSGTATLVYHATAVGPTNPATLNTAMTNVVLPFAEMIPFGATIATDVVTVSGAVVTRTIVFNLDNSYIVITGTVTGVSGNPLVISAVANGAINGQNMFITGVLGEPAANGIFAPNVIDADHFEIYGPTVAVKTVSSLGSNPIVIETVTPHGLVTGDKVKVDGIVGVNNVPAVVVTNANGVFVVTVIDATHFSRPTPSDSTYRSGGVVGPGVKGVGAYTSGGFTKTIPVWQHGSDPAAVFRNLYTYKLSNALGCVITADEPVVA